LTGSSSLFIDKPIPIDDPTQRCPDITVAKRHLRFEPRVPLEEGLKLTIEHFKRVI
jgi:UDP-glucuronate decarboxylase